MAKNDTTKPSAPGAEVAPVTGDTQVRKPADPPPLPALGASCVVRVAAGVSLMNNETGQHFEPETDTPVTADITLLRRLQDGDLTLVS